MNHLIKIIKMIDYSISLTWEFAAKNWHYLGQKEVILWQDKCYYIFLKLKILKPTTFVQYGCTSQVSRLWGYGINSNRFNNSIWIMTLALREKCPYSEFFVVRIFPYFVRMRENTDQENSEYGHFLLSVGDKYVWWVEMNSSIFCRYFGEIFYLLEIC